MRPLARLLARKPVAWGVIVVVLAVTGILSWSASGVGRDDDLLAFLPADNADVAMFRQINERFGGLGVGIVGIEVEDPFDGEFLSQLRMLTQKLNDEASITYALSLANVEDFALDETKGGFRADYLINPLPTNEQQSAALRAKVMSKRHIVGNLVSSNASSVIIYCFFAPEAEPRITASTVQAAVSKELAGYTLYWGGAPFVSTYIYDTTQSDMRRLIPWAVLVIITIIVISFRDVIGALLALVSTGMGIAVAHGLMAIQGVDVNIVLGSMPVILFAVGSAYAIHVMVRYYALRAEHECEEAIVEALSDVGPTVLAAGLTTVAGLMSFLAMDIRPMREFGLYTGLGILAALILSLTFVPAVIRVMDLKARSFGQSAFRVALTTVTSRSCSWRVPIIVLLVTVFAAGGVFTFRVQARMENAAFFAEGSPPDRAEAFLRDQFGGSQFVQLMIEGDMTDPLVLREMQRVADVIATEPHVSSVTHVGQVLALVNEAFSGERRIPVTVEQVRTLYRLLGDRAAISKFVDGERAHGLIMVKINTLDFEAVEAVVARIEALARDEVVTDYTVAQGDDRLGEIVVARIVAHLHQHGLVGKREAISERVMSMRPGDADPEAVRGRLATFLRSEESLLEEEHDRYVDALARALVTAGPAFTEAAIHAAVSKTLPVPEDDPDAPDPDLVSDHRELVDDVASMLMVPLSEIWRSVSAQAAAKRIVDGFAVPDEALAGVTAALFDLDLGRVLVAAAGEPTGTLAYVVNGTPVLYRGLSQSVTENQFKSLAMALGLVLVIMIALFRSLFSGLLAAVPTVLTLLAVYGFMGARGLHLDIGTSMLASIIIGAGVDYAVHLLAAWRAEDGELLSRAAERAAEHAGPAIWINALMVAAGFFVLTLGDAKPLQNVGGLTSVAMLVAALATFVALPALARKRSYRRRDTQPDTQPDAQADTQPDAG